MEVTCARAHDDYIAQDNPLRLRYASGSARSASSREFRGICRRIMADAAHHRGMLRRARAAARQLLQLTSTLYKTWDAAEPPPPSRSA